MTCDFRWVERWHADFAVTVLFLLKAKLCSTINEVPLQTAFRRPDMTEILLKTM